MTPVSLVTACWGGYWEKYGDEFVASVQGLTTQPDEVIVATDEPLVLPDGWKQIPASEPYFFDAWNDAFMAARNEWVTFLSMDDKLFPHALDQLTLGGDVTVCSVLDSNGTICTPDLEKYDNIFNENLYPLVGWCIYRKSTIERIPFRRVNLTDWIAALEYRAAGLDVRVDPVVRYWYRLHPGQLSWRGNWDDVNLMKELLPTGRVVPGREFPPVLV